MSTSARAALRRVLSKPADPDRVGQIDDELVRTLAPKVQALCRRWYRLEARHLDRLPAGPALVVANHESGMTMLEAFGWGAQVSLERPEDRWNALAHDQIVDMPGLGRVLIALGAVRARPDPALEALAQGHKVLVFPGGNLEAFKPHARRLNVEFGGRTGWAKLAVRAGVPIVPVVFHGGHSGFRILSDGRRLARLIGAKKFLRSDTWPIMVALPWGLWIGPNFHLPLPVKVTSSVLDPVPTAHLGPDAAEDPHILATLSERVRGAMEAELHAIERGRGGAA